MSRIPAIVGGGLGVLTAVAAAAVAQQRRTAARERSRIEVGSAELLCAPGVRDEGLVLTDDGVELHYEEVGGGAGDAGLTVLFVHGYTLNLGSFVFQRRALTEAFGDSVRQVFYDQRSHGRSARAPSQSCTIEQLGHDLHSVIDQLIPAGPIVLVGHSMGGMTVMALAHQHPELFRATESGPARVQAVVLVNTSSGELKNLTLGLPSVLARLNAPVLPIVLRRAAKNAALVEQARTMGRDLAWAMTKRLSFAAKDVDPAVVAYCTTMISATPVDVVADFYPTLMAHDGRLGLRNLKGSPVLVIGSDSDAMTPLEHSQAIARELPEARLIVTENSGHLLMLEHPELVNQPLLDIVETALAGVPGVDQAVSA
ncbi:alpha/beta fold hydrolase [Jatrophihabitans sp.]|uniref:alpha/beta fold hydrolase n=1 Tax=Jatrophihabitans sp. TaxID=1932789 RepID=UPI0038CD1929